MALRLQHRYSLMITALIIIISVILVGFLMYKGSEALRQTATSSKTIMQSALQSQLQRRAEQAVHILSENLINPLYQYDIRVIYEQIRSVKTDEDIRFVMLYNERGELIHDGEETLSRYGEMISDKAALDAMQSGERDVLVKVEGEYLKVFRPIYIGDTQLLGGVEIGISLDAIQTESKLMQSELNRISYMIRDETMLRLLMATLLMLLAGVVAAFIVAGRITSPIREAAGFADRVGEGQYGTQIELVRKDEIGELMQALNVMSLNLQQTSVSRKFMEDILASMADALIVLDKDGNIQFSNSILMKWLQLSEAALHGQPLHRLFVDGSAGQQASWLDEVRHTDNVACEDVLLTTPGSKLPVSISLSCLDCSEGEPHGYVCLLKDMTEHLQIQENLRMAKEEAERANHAKSEFLSSMSHELRTPMHAILGFTQLLELEEGLNDSQQNSIRHIHQAGDHLMKLIQEVLDLAQIESGRMSVKPESVELAPLLESCCTFVRPMAESQSIKLQCGTGDEYHWVWADPSRLRQVILNLLSNAVKYNQPGGEVSISIQPVPADMIRISVTDTGPGLSIEQQARLFLPFDRLGHESTNVAGTGIGLVISKKLMNMMHGSIGLESSPGKGATFWLDIPLEKRADVDIEQPKVSVDDRRIRKTSAGRTALCIDDNLGNLVMLETALKQMTGLTVLMADSARQGLEMAKEHIPDLIFLDIHMPEMDGYEVLQRLKANDALRDIPIVALTASAMQVEIERGLVAGFYRYLTKPVDVHQMIKIVNEILDKLDGAAPDAGQVSGTGQT